MHYYITYDISETKLRNKLIKTLNKYSTRVQLSVFKSVVQISDINLIIKTIKTKIAPNMQYNDSILIIPYNENSKKLIKFSNLEDNTNPDIFV